MAPGAKIMRAELLLRVACVALAAMSALLMGLDAQTKTMVFINKKATAKDVEALWVFTIAAAVAAGYQFVQLCKCFYVCCQQKESHCQSNKMMAWLCFLLDQGCTYVVFATAMAAFQGSVIALTGVDTLQWAKLCNIYTRFCFQVSGSLVSGLVTTLAMAIVSSVSAHRLFQLYPKASSSGGRRRPWALL